MSKQIPRMTKFIICREVELSYAQLTESEVLKLNKPQLQSVVVAERKLILSQRKYIAELKHMVKDLPAMVVLLERHGYVITYPESNKIEKGTS